MTFALFEGSRVQVGIERIAVTVDNDRAFTTENVVFHTLFHITVLEFIG